MFHYNWCKNEGITLQINHCARDKRSLHARSKVSRRNHVLFHEFQLRRSRKHSLCIYESIIYADSTKLETLCSAFDQSLKISLVSAQRKFKFNCILK